MARPLLLILGRVRGSMSDMLMIVANLQDDGITKNALQAYLDDPGSVPDAERGVLDRRTRRQLEKALAHWE